MRRHLNRTCLLVPPATPSGEDTPYSPEMVGASVAASFHWILDPVTLMDGCGRGVEAWDYTLPRHMASALSHFQFAKMCKRPAKCEGRTWKELSFSPVASDSTVRQPIEPLLCAKPGEMYSMHIIWMVLTGSAVTQWCVSIISEGCC